MTDTFGFDPDEQKDFQKAQHVRILERFQFASDLANQICRSGSAADAWDAYRRLWKNYRGMMDSFRDECAALKHVPAAKLKDATGLLESSAHGAAATFIDQVFNCWRDNLGPDDYRARATEFETLWQEQIKPALLALPTIDATKLIGWMKEEITLLTGDTILATCDRLIEGIYELCALQNARARNPLKIEQAHAAITPGILSILQIIEKWSLCGGDAQPSDDPLRQFLHDPARCPDPYDFSSPSGDILFLLRMVRAEAIRREEADRVHLQPSKPIIAPPPAATEETAPAEVKVKSGLSGGNLDAEVQRLIDECLKNGAMPRVRMLARLTGRSNATITDTLAWGREMERRSSTEKDPLKVLIADQAKDDRRQRVRSHAS